MFQALSEAEMVTASGGMTKYKGNAFTEGDKTCQYVAYDVDDDGEIDKIWKNCWYT